MRLLLFLTLLSSQISAELMSLKCEYEFKSGEKLLTSSNIFIFDKNEGATADVEQYNYTGKLVNTIGGASLIWSPSIITIKYSSNNGLFQYIDVINRVSLTYQTTLTTGGRSSTPDKGQCKVNEVTPKNVF